jgi:hypothetical protein
MSDADAVELVRLYVDSFGESRFETVPVPMATKAFAPPAAPLRVTEAQPAQHYVIIELPVGWGGAEPHPTPARHLLLCLSGHFQVTASSGETRSFATGDGLLLEDTSGKGHTTVVTSNEPVRAVMIRLG